MTITIQNIYAISAPTAPGSVYAVAYNAFPYMLAVDPRIYAKIYKENERRLSGLSGPFC